MGCTKSELFRLIGIEFRVASSELAAGKGIKVKGRELPLEANETLLIISGRTEESEKVSGFPPLFKRELLRGGAKQFHRRMGLSQK